MDFKIFNLMFLLGIIDQSITHDWNYAENGPAVWSEMYPICGGTKQSPINILTACTAYKSFKPFIFETAYNEQHSFTLKNNGHNIVGTFNNEPNVPTLHLTGGDLNGTFQFVNFHLHWGENHKSGSEHEVNGIQHPGEIHFVYTNSLSNQTAVLGVFMQSSYVYNETENNTGNSFSDEDTLNEWQRFFNIAQTLQQEDNFTIINLNLALLMGESLQDFWRYQGSLTTPPCTENVIWTIFKKPILFSENEFKSLRQNVYFQDYRHPQPLYTRTIYRNFVNEELSSIPDYNCCLKNNDLSKLHSNFHILFLFLFFSLFVGVSDVFCLNK